MDSPFSTFPLSHRWPLSPYFFMFHYFKFAYIYVCVFVCFFASCERTRGSIVENPTIPFVRLGVVADHTHTHARSVCVCVCTLLYLVLVRQMAGGGRRGEGGGIGEERGGGATWSVFGL